LVWLIKSELLEKYIEGKKLQERRIRTESGNHIDNPLIKVTAYAMMIVNMALKGQ